MDNPDLPLNLQGQRTLAAIVFTDGVSFSARMAADEEHTLELVQRDLQLMTELCQRFEGRVLKSTGDGLLMYFSSAIQAVACAQEIQKTLAEAAASLPPENVLSHRIGIHLGDVFFSETDVMGNGVNIAARLQAQAEPGGICISQTVYDVVKNSLALQVTYLGPRELKNIREAIPVYQILLASQTPQTGGEAPEVLAGITSGSGNVPETIALPEPQVASSATQPKRPFPWIPVGLGVAVLVIGVAGLSQLRGTAQKTTTLASAQALQAAGNYEGCIAQASQASVSDSAYAEVQNLLHQCQLAQAKKLSAEGKVPGAIATINQIPPNSPVYPEAQALLEQWQPERPLEPLSEEAPRTKQKQKRGGRKN